MELRHLKYFLAVASARSFTKAAAECYVAQSAHDVGVTIVPRSAATLLHPAGRGHAEFSVLRLSDPAAVHPVSVVYDAPRLAPAAAAFLGVLDRHAGGAPAQ